MFDLLLRRARVDGIAHEIDLGVKDGLIVAMTPGLPEAVSTFDLEGAYLFPGFVETHIHLDKGCILERCAICEGTLAEAISLTAAAKTGFTQEDVYARGQRVLEKAIFGGTSFLRSFVEVDPRAGLRSLDAILALKADYAWAIDIEICAFAQDGITQEMETLALLEEALVRGADLIGGCPYTDADPAGHISLIFDLAEKQDVAIDFHIDFDLEPSGSNIEHVVHETMRRGFGGRVSIGHATKLSAMPPHQRDLIATRLAQAGIALTVLPATDLYISGRNASHLVPRGVAPAHGWPGLTRSIGTNNVLNPFTPFGDASLLRMANLYANIAQLGTDQELQAVLEMVGAEAARLVGIRYGLEVGGPASFVALDNTNAVLALREISPPLAGWKNGRQVFIRPRATLCPARATGTYSHTD